MKILLLDMGKIIRGGQRQVYYLARHLIRTPGFDPLVVIPAKAPLRALLDEANIPYVTLSSSSDLNPLNLFRLLRLITTHQPAIIHTNDAKGASLAALAKKIIGEFKLVHSRRVSYRLKPGWSRKKYLEGDALVAVSREIQEVLVDCGVPANKTSTIHSGLDAAMYSTEKHRHSVLTIGAVGALSTQKGFEILIEALGVLKKDTSMPDWQCLIAGDGPLLQELKAQADKLKLTDSILFLGYRDSREVLPEIDILTVPSVDGEGSNAVIKEGWASEIPVVTSDLPSNLELVTHEYNGLIFRNRKAEDLAAAISSLFMIAGSELIDTMILHIREAIVDSANGCEALGNFVQTYLEFTIENEKTFPTMIRCSPFSDDNPDLDRHKIGSKFRELIDIIEEILQRGIDDGSILDLPVTQTAFMVYANILGAVRTRFLTPYTVSGLYSEARNFIMRSVCTPKNLAL